MILNKSQILDRIIKKPCMVSNIKDLSSQLQPAGLDLTVKNIFQFDTSGTLDFDNSNRVLSQKHELNLFDSKQYSLAKGCYQIELNEMFNIPLDVLGFTVSRSSLQRCGASTLKGYFEPGFKGTGFVLLEIYNSCGLFLYKNARICQMIFHTTEKTDGYNGIYQEK